MAVANVATWTGRTILLNRLHGVGTEPLNIGWGYANGGASQVTGSAITDVNLFGSVNTGSPEARQGSTTVTQLTANQLADTYQVVGTITALAARTIAEVGLFDTATSLSPLTQITTSSMAAAATTVTIGPTVSGYPAMPTAGNYLAQIENEVVLVTGGQGTSTLTVTRAQLGSTSAAHAIAQFVTAAGDGGAHGANATITPTATLNSAGANGGSMFVHADFANIALNTSDSIQFTLKVQLT